LTFTGSFDPQSEAKVYSSGSALRTDISGLGVFSFAPARLANDEIIVVDRGFIPDGASAVDTPRIPVRMTGYIRFP
jgi:cytochrome oxidase assembly protein ShyY1